MPTNQELVYSPLLPRVLPALPEGIPVYLVGGGVRDALLGVTTYDLDFALLGDALGVARRVADALGGAYYPLDDELGTGRVILTDPDGSRQILDFAAFRGPDLESDLRARDFTVNALAAEARQPQTLIDPIGGIPDLYRRRLRACSPEAFTADPLRILRGVRLANGLEFHILADTRRLMRAAVPLLAQTSPERKRDEILRMLDGPRPAAALGALDLLGALPELFPELMAMKGMGQPAPHTTDVWAHTLRTLGELEVLLGVLGPQHDAEAAGDLFLSLAVLRLGRYRFQISDHFSLPLNPNRTLRALLFLAALYHDAGKPETRGVDEAGRIRFLRHEQVGASLGAQRGRELRLSNQEIQRLETLIRHHLRPLLLAQSGESPTRRAIYRFFRDTGPAGVEICLLSLADLRATYGPSLPPETWAAHLDVVRTLLEAWWEKHQESVAPPPLLDGRDLIESFNLESGPQLGNLLEYLYEAQASGQIINRTQALEAARSWLSGSNQPPPALPSD